MINKQTITIMFPKSKGNTTMNLTKRELLAVCKTMNIKGVSTYNKERLTHIIYVVRMQRLRRKIKKTKKELMYELFGTDSEDETVELNRQDAVEDDDSDDTIPIENEEDVENDDSDDTIPIENEEVPELHHNEDDLEKFLNENTYIVVLVYSPECQPCKDFKPDFCKLIENKRVRHGVEIPVKFGCFDLEKYEETFGEIEDTHIDTYPTVELCKRGRIFKTMAAPSINAINKQIDDMIYCRSLKALKDECKDRGMISSGTLKELSYRVIEDDNIGWNLQDKNHSELVDYIDQNNMTKPRKMIDMTDTQLRKHIRKQK